MGRLIFKFILVFLCMFIIFSFSSDNGERSTNKSDGVISKGINFVTLGRLSKEESAQLLKFLVIPVRKTAHFLIYFILGILVLNLFVEFKWMDYKTWIFALIFCFMYAFSDEVHQLFVKGRSGSFLDVLIDTVGSYLGIFVYKHFYRKRESK